MPAKKSDAELIQGDRYHTYGIHLAEDGKYYTVVAVIEGGKVLKSTYWEDSHGEIEKEHAGENLLKCLLQLESVR